jgi:hypothetical protein
MEPHVLVSPGVIIETDQSQHFWQHGSEDSGLVKSVQTEVGTRSEQDLVQVLAHCDRSERLQIPPFCLDGFRRERMTHDSR